MSNLTLPLSSPPTGALPALARFSGALGLQPCLEPLPTVPPQPVPVKVAAPPEPLNPPGTGSLPDFDNPPAAVSATHCSVKGCVFPPLGEGLGECHYHHLFRTEAVLFQSHQPSHLLLLRAPLGVPEEEFDDSRLQDRKRLAAEHEDFVLDEPREPA